MKTALRRSFGLLTLLIGLALLGWMVYNMIHPQPEFTGSTNRGMFRGLIFAVVVSGVGAYWLFGPSKSTPKQ
jgi:hypothetical protein